MFRKIFLQNFQVLLCMIKRYSSWINFTFQNSCFQFRLCSKKNYPKIVYFQGFNSIFLMFTMFIHCFLKFVTCVSICKASKFSFSFRCGFYFKFLDFLQSTRKNANENSKLMKFSSTLYGFAQWSFLFFLRISKEIKRDQTGPGFPKRILRYDFTAALKNNNNMFIICLGFLQDFQVSSCFRMQSRFCGQNLSLISKNN